MNKTETIARARQLRQEDQLEASQELLFQLMKQYPDDPLVLFEVGGSFDVLGQEADAIPYYQEAIEAGLSGADLQECLVCLGSSLRVTGQFDEAVDTLEQAVAQFPDNNSGRVFLALAYYSQGEYEAATRLLLSLLLETTQDDDILAYSGALEYYKENLDEVIIE
ncbi:MAG: tetratricopeptide repeat protein [Candidatus Promineifilaceae bacterium]